MDHIPEEKRVYIFDKKRFLDDKLKEREFIKSTYSHPLFLLITKHIKLDFIILWRDLSKDYTLDCVTITNRDDLPNFDKNHKLGQDIYSLVLEYSIIMDDYKDLSNFIERSRFNIKKKIKNFINKDFFSYDLNLKLGLIEAYIEFFELKKNKYPQSELFSGIINDLRIQKNNILVLNEKTGATSLEQEKEKTNNLPYKIALLNEIGFFDLPLIKNLTATKKIEVIKQLIGGTDRQIKGNINVLKPQSMDNRTRYTSFTYEDEVKKFVSKLFNT